MPAYLESSDVASLKWIAGFRGNRRRGLPYISGLIILNDPSTGRPTAVIDAAEITAARTAAASAVCIERFAPTGAKLVAILGCGEQGQYHARLLTALRPELELVAYDVHPERAEALSPRATTAASARLAVDEADVVVTAGPLVDDPDPPLEPNWLGDSWLVLPLDFDSYVSAALASAADALVCDDAGQFEYYRSRGRFVDWPTPHAEVLDELPPAGRILCCNLGLGTLDAAFADYVVRRALETAVGRLLPL
jgi:ornithine cyclodeaminase/alanine dehydrogenase